MRKIKVNKEKANANVVRLVTTLAGINRYLINHKKILDNDIKQNDGYLKPYIKGRLTRAINICSVLYEKYKNIETNNEKLIIKTIIDIDSVLEKEKDDPGLPKNLTLNFLGFWNNAVYLGKLMETIKSEGILNEYNELLNNIIIYNDFYRKEILD